MALGLAVTVSGCDASHSSSPPARPRPPAVPPAHVAVPPLPPIPAPHPGPPTQISHGVKGTDKICLTVDDGYCTSCVSGYLDFVRRSGIHLTFSPNGTYSRCWAPHADVLRPLLERQQVQIINHTFSHHDLLKMSD
jgi:peptidoglycan/xylan/chitin deacetylase (PgdA/CDA1 family)